MYLAENFKTPISELEKLAVDESEIVRQSVAGNNNITISLLEKLVDDEDEWVRNNVAYNRITPANLLEKLAEDGNENHPPRHQTHPCGYIRANWHD